MNKFYVTPKAKRPASNKDECFYCQERIENFHKNDCVLINKKVKMKMTIDFEMEVPNHWDKDMMEFHKNESSWCCSNVIDQILEIDEKEGCLCSVCEFEYVEDMSEAFLDE